MKLLYFSILCLSVVGIVLMDEQKFDPKEVIEKLEQLLCNDNKPLTDDQCTNIINKCPYNKQAIKDDAIKDCLKLDKLSDRQRLTGFCGSQKQCVVDKIASKAVVKEKAEDVKAYLDKHIICINNELKV